MRTLPDKWNPRLWLRSWLTAPSWTEREQAAAAKARSEKVMAEFRATCDAIRESRAAEQVTDR